MTVKEKLEILEEIFEMDEGTLKEDMILEDIEEWDSLAKLVLMATIKKRFNRRITTNELKSFQTVKDICDYLE